MSVSWPPWTIATTASPPHSSPLSPTSALLMPRCLPGSRNTPMSMTLAAEDRIRDWSHHDERSAGFFALGIAKASGIPALVTCTSGTAAAEIHPAVVEARYGQGPAHRRHRRPPIRSLGGRRRPDHRPAAASSGAPPLWSHDLDVPAPGDAPAGYPAALAARLVAESDRGRGPVHLNLRFREPLVPADGIPAPDGPSPVARPRRRGPRRPMPSKAIAESLAGRRGLIVVGPQHDPAVAAAAADLGSRHRVPDPPRSPVGAPGGYARRSRSIGSAAGLLAGRGARPPHARGGPPDRADHRSARL